MKSETIETKTVLSLASIITSMKENIGKGICIKEYNRQSKKMLNEFNGNIFEVHPNLFIMTIPHKNYVEKKAFSYSGIQSGLLEYAIEK